MSNPINYLQGSPQRSILPVGCLLLDVAVISKNPTLSCHLSLLHFMPCLLPPLHCAVRNPPYSTTSSAFTPFRSLFFIMHDSRIDSSIQAIQPQTTPQSNCKQRSLINFHPPFLHPPTRFHQWGFRTRSTSNIWWFSKKYENDLGHHTSLIAEGRPPRSSSSGIMSKSLVSFLLWLCLLVFGGRGGGRAVVERQERSVSPLLRVIITSSAQSDSGDLQLPSY